MKVKSVRAFRIEWTFYIEYCWIFARSSNEIICCFVICSRFVRECAGVWVSVCLCESAINVQNFTQSILHIIWICFEAFTPTRLQLLHAFTSFNTTLYRMNIEFLIVNWPLSHRHAHNCVYSHAVHFSSNAEMIGLNDVNANVYQHSCSSRLLSPLLASHFSVWAYDLFCQTFDENCVKTLFVGLCVWKWMRVCLCLWMDELWWASLVQQAGWMGNSNIVINI